MPSSFAYSISDRKILEDELEALNKIGFPAEFADKLPLPFPVVGAVQFRKQAEFHPLKFLSAISRGLNIYENTCVKELTEHTAVTENGKITAKKMIVATHFPFINKHGSYFLKMYQHRSYVIALENAPDLNGMYIDEAEKGMSFRNYKNLLLVGGGSHRTGKKGGNWTELETFADTYYPNARKVYRWATQDCMTLDSVPYIGRYSKHTPDFYVATGFNKWGMTSSNVAGNIIVDKILGRENEYENVFKATRLHPIKNNVELGNMIKETTNSFVINKFKVPDADLDVIEDNSVMSGSKKAGNFEEIKNDSGHVLKYNGQTIGIYKDNDGKIFAVNPICTHLGCLLSWNNLDKTWDCPCHGSRFDYKGHQLYNPAIRDLDVIDLS